MNSRFTVARAPYRISIVGGGLDLVNRGSVISFTIDKYCYVVVNQRPDSKVVCSYRQREEVEKASDLKHEMFRAALEHFGIEHGIEIHSISDIPMVGCGLGTSSAFLVALVQALSPAMAKGEVAETALHIERDLVGKRCGGQDHYASAYGGLNCISFGSGLLGGPGVTVECLNEHKDRLSKLRLFLYGSSRVNDELLKNYQVSPEVEEEMMDLVRWAYRQLKNNGNPIWGWMLRKAWLLKRQMSGLDDPDLEELLIKSNGKLCGGGASGYILTCKSELPLPELKFALDSEGVKVLT